MTKQELTEAINRAFLTAAGKLANMLTPEEWDAMPDKEELIAEAAAVYLKGYIDAHNAAAAAHEITDEITGKE